jgi:hypothetical protein
VMRVALGEDEDDLLALFANLNMQQKEKIE